MKVTPNNIEKCPSILYLKIEAIKENWKFLNEKKINTRDVETCLHILSTDPEQLKKTYEYVSAENRYGKKYIEQITTILRVSVERIQEIEEKCQELTKENILSAANSRKDVDEIKKIEQVCKENGIEITGSIFSKNSKQLKGNIEYIKQNYGEKYLTPLIVSKNLKHLQKTLPYLQSIGVLEIIKTSASILMLTVEEIKERQAFIESIGETIVIDGKFNRIFGMPKKRYQKKVKEYEEKKKIIGDIKGAIQEGQELDEQINHKKQEQK